MLIGNDGAEAARRGPEAGVLAPAWTAALISCGSFGRRLSCASRGPLADGLRTSAPTGGETSLRMATLTSGLESTDCAQAPCATSTEMTAIIEVFMASP